MSWWITIIKKKNMSNLVKKEMDRMKSIMLHEVGVSKEVFTENKRLLFESTGGGDIIEALMSLTRSLKGIPAKNADELVKLIAKNSEFITKNPKQIEELIVDIYFNKNAEMVGRELFDDWSNSIYEVIGTTLSRNRKYKGKSLDDIEFNFRGAKKSVKAHIDELLSASGGVRDSFTDAVKKIEDLLQNPKLIEGASPKDVVKIIEDNYGDILKLIDPDGKILKQMEDEFVLLKEGYTRNLKMFDDLGEEIIDAYAETNKRLIRQKAAAKRYGDAILARFTKSLAKWMKKYPRFAKLIGAFAKMLGKFKAWLEYFSTPLFNVKDTKLGTIINLAGTHNLDAIPLANFKTLYDVTHIPARIGKYTYELIKNGGDFKGIKSIEQISRNWSQAVFVTTGMYYMGSLHWLADGIEWAMKRLFNVEIWNSYQSVCIMKAIDDASSFGFKDIPTSGENDYTVEGQMEDVLNGDGDKDGKFKDFKFEEFVRGVAEAGKKEGVEESWFGWDRTGKIVNLTKWEDFIYPYKTKKVNVDGVVKYVFEEPKVRTKPYGDVPDWAFYIAACDDNGFTLFNIFQKEKTYTKRRQDVKEKDVLKWLGDTKKNTKDQYEQFKNEADSTGTNIKNQVDAQLEPIKNGVNTFKNSKEIQAELTRLGAECAKTKDPEICAQVGELSKQLSEMMKGADSDVKKTEKLDGNTLFGKKKKEPE
jgi:hypothetical protein